MCLLYEQNWQKGDINASLLSYIDLGVFYAITPENSVRILSPLLFIKFSIAVYQQWSTAFFHTTRNI